MKDFKLQLNNPPGNVYFPGMTITGTIFGSTDEPKNYKAIQVRLVGGAHVHWSESRGSGENRRTVHYSSSESYIDTFIRVWDKQTSAGGGQFPIGHFQFPFSLQLVGANLPPSYEGTVGRISYKIEARVMKEGLLKRDKTCEAYIALANVVPINQPDLMQPLRMETRKTVCCLCCASGPIVITASIPRKGYCIQKDTIPVEISVENASNRNIGTISVALQKVVQYYAEGHYRYDHFKVSNVIGERIPAHNSTEWRPVLTVPDTSTTLPNCGIIKVYYNVHILASIWGISPKINMPVVIGNVPLDGQGGSGETGGLEFGYQPAPPLQPTAPPSLFDPVEQTDPRGGIPLNPYPPPPAYSQPTSQLPIGFVDPIQKI